ncbi:glycosyltransferase family 4 protein [Halocatena marina]|uniref:Glycosyltransferase family 4 protein n=1 Tax=Halocatena marina TaxID=2934937 RepID=A0ABD5YM94_9EURY|nr:glycosyltransferase family 4 protein [Halocatena marina]
MNDTNTIAIAHHNLMEMGGAEGVGMNVIEALQDQYDVTLLTLTHPDFTKLNSYYNTEVDEHAIEVQQIGLVTPTLYEQTKSLHLLKNAFVSRLMASRADQFDMVFCTYNELSLAGRSLQYIHMPQFRRWTNGGADSTLLSVYDELCKGIEGFDTEQISTNHLLANSEWTADVTEQTYGVRPQVVYPPVDTDGFVDTPWDEREDGFVSVGRIGPKKNVLRTIKIVAALHDRGHDVHLHIVGPPHGEEYIESVEAAADQHEFVHLEGILSRKELVDLICTHKYGIHGKNHEHFGMAVAELAAAGTIPFVPDGGGQREIVNERAELLYEAKNDAVEKIDHVLSTPELQSELTSTTENVKERFGRRRFQRIICDIVEDQFNESE